MAGAERGQTSGNFAVHFRTPARFFNCYAFPASSSRTTPGQADDLLEDHGVGLLAKTGPGRSPFPKNTEGL